jgi:hypothetical protein
VAEEEGNGQPRLACTRRRPWCIAERFEVAQPRETTARRRARVAAMERLRWRCGVLDSRERGAEGGRPELDDGGARLGWKESTTVIGAGAPPHGNGCPGG